MAWSQVLYDNAPSWRLLASGFGLILAYYLVASPIYNLYFHPLRKYPGPKLWAAFVWPWIVHFMSGDLHHHVAAFHERYGPVVRLAPDELSYLDPNAWEDVCGRQKPGKREENAKAPWYVAPESHNIVGQKHEDHQRMRKLLVPGFSSTAMVAQQPMISKYIDLLIQRLHEKARRGAATLDMHAWCNYTTFDIIGDLSFGEPFDCLEEANLHPWIALIFTRIKLITWGSVCNRVKLCYLAMPFLIGPRMAMEFMEHMKVTKGKIAKRLARTDTRPDFLQAMVAGKKGNTFSSEELEMNATLLTMAGSETTATALTTALYYVSTVPGVQAKLIDEMRAHFADESEINFLSAAHLPYLCAVAEETLRCRPPSPNALPRITPAKGNEILGEWVPGKTVVGIPFMAMFTSETNFRRAKEFVPERWLPEGKEGEFAQDRRDAFHPFSFGPRNCIGMNLAYAEFRMILARILWNFDVKLAPESAGWFEQSKCYFLWSKQPLYMHLTPRVEQR